MDRNLKKLTHRYEFLKLELEEIEEKYDSYINTWAEKFGKYSVDQNKVAYQNTDTGEIRFENPEEIKEESRLKKEEPPKRLKAAYRKLSSKLHPDKGGNAEIFTQLKEFYDSGNIVELARLAIENNVEFEIEEEDEQKIINTCEELVSKINNLQQSIPWIYSTGDYHSKIHAIRIFENRLGIKVNEEDLPNE